MDKFLMITVISCTGIALGLNLAAFLHKAIKGKPRVKWKD